MFGVFSLVGSALSFLTGLAPAISSYLLTAKNVEAQEFAAMTQEEREEFIAYTKSATALNEAKVQNNRTTSAHLMVYLFGVPPAIHWAGVYLTATFPQLGLHVDPLHGYYALSEKTIAESFFLLAPAIPVVGALAQRLRA